MTYLEKFKKIWSEFMDFNKRKIPLCAAENYTSKFVRQALSSQYEGKYIQGYLERIIDKDNIGSDELYKLLSLTNELCEELFNAKYADSRTLSGMNCLAVLIMSLINDNSKLIITTKEMGGHPSLAAILDRLGISYLAMPYDYAKHQIDYGELNQIMKNTREVSFIVFCQSDVIDPPDLSKLEIPNDVGIIYDGSQTLGLIAAKLLPNPLECCDNIILVGGTHKTLPGPTCGLIMTNNNDYIKAIDYKISPTFLRNIQPNNIAGLCLALIEQQSVGLDYQTKIIDNANYLGLQLMKKGIKVRQISDKVFSRTHQLFLEFTPEVTDSIYELARQNFVTLNKRKSAFHTGIRLGVQEVTRYNYSREDFDLIAEMIFLFAHSDSSDKIQQIVSKLQTKKMPSFVEYDTFME